MNFQTSVKTCLTEKYARFQGRASRSEYWWFFLAVVIGSLVATLLGPLSLLFSLAVICPMLAVGFRRLQDTGRPGWWIVIPSALGLLTSVLAPDVPNTEAIMATGEVPRMGGILLFSILGVVQFIVTLVFLWWLTRPSDPQTNAYGPPPAA